MTIQALIFYFKEQVVHQLVSLVYKQYQTIYLSYIIIIRSLRICLVQLNHLLRNLGSQSSDLRKQIVVYVKMHITSYGQLLLDSLY